LEVEEAGMTKSIGLEKTTEAVPVFTISGLITSTDTDMEHRQRPSSMFGIFQDIAAAHARNLGADVSWLRDELDLAWILMRIRLEIDNYPMRGQEILVDTWPQDPRALYERDYTIKDLEGNSFARAASTWVIMNLDTREIKRDKFLDYFGIETKKERALKGGVPRLKPLEGAETVYEKKIMFSDIDYNWHVNNAKYVDFIMDVFTFEEYKKREVKALEVHYINEVGPEEVLLIRRNKIDADKDYVDGVLKANGGIVFNALVEWRDT